MSALALFAVGYAVVWSLRAARRVGVRRFTGALGTLGWTFVNAVFKLFQPSNARSMTPKVRESDDAFWVSESLRIARETQKRCDERGKIGSPSHGSFDDDPFGT